MKASRSRRILLEAYKRCTVEPGSAEAANYPISGGVASLTPCISRNYLSKRIVAAAICCSPENASLRQAMSMPWVVLCCPCRQHAEAPLSGTLKLGRRWRPRACPWRPGNRPGAADTTVLGRRRRHQHPTHCAAAASTGCTRGN